MARKTKPENRREGRGISLLPALWARIDRLAEAQEKSRSEIVEEVLSLHLPAVVNFRKSDENTQRVDDEVVDLP